MMLNDVTEHRYVSAQHHSQHRAVEAAAAAASLSPLPRPTDRQHHRGWASPNYELTHYCRAVIRQGVPSPEHKYGYRNSGLTEIYLHF
jgi:hypothetical protein